MTALVTSSNASVALTLDNSQEIHSCGAHNSTHYCRCVLLIMCQEVHVMAFMVTLNCFIGARIFFCGSCSSEKGKLCLSSIVLTGVIATEGKHGWGVEGLSMVSGSIGMVTHGERCELCFLVITAAIHQKVTKALAFSHPLSLPTGDRIQMLWTIWKFFLRSLWDPPLHSF